MPWWLHLIRLSPLKHQLHGHLRSARPKQLDIQMLQFATNATMGMELITPTLTPKRSRSDRKSTAPSLWVIVLTVLLRSKIIKIQHLDPNMLPKFMQHLQNMWLWPSTQPVLLCLQMSIQLIAEDSLLVWLNHQVVVEEHIQEEPKLVHHLTLPFLSFRTLMQDTPRLSALNVKTHLVALFSTTTGQLNRPEIVPQLWLDKPKQLCMAMLKLRTKISHLCTWLQPLTSFSLWILMLLYAELSQHAHWKSLDVVLTTLERILSSMLQLEK